MITVRRTTPDDPAFRSLVAELDADLLNRYGAKQQEYDVHNTALDGASVVIAMSQDSPVGCGCFKTFGQNDTVELKRMYVQPSARRLGVARQLVAELERWAREKGYAKTNLQTAVKQPEAIALYLKCGYRPMDNYGAYAGDADSVCMEKHL
ncbi:MAG: GNAT family N-acetyltransferase [Bacteroidetes bacterium]|nr:GNAT family N-acetyltransferase [Fibrella sp.]